MFLHIFALYVGVGVAKRILTTGEQSTSWWTFRIFFFCLGRGRGKSEAPGGGGGQFLLRIPGGGSPGRVGAEEGMGPGGCLRGILGATFFFSGPKLPPRDSACRKPQIFIDL